MHVGLNLVFLVPGQTGGMETVARELIPELVAAAPPDVRFTAFVGRESGPGPWTELMAAVELPVRASRRAEWVRGEQLLLPRRAARAGVDVVHSLGSTAPARGRFRRIATVHDLIYRHHPETHGALRALGMRVLVPLAVRNSHRVIADSRHTRDDLVALLGTPAQKIDVVPLGIGSPQRVAATPAPEVRDRFGLGERPLLLCLAAKRPHKNIAALLEALALLDERPVLVVAGYPTPYEHELRARAGELGVADDVRWPGWLPDAVLEGLWAIADGFVFPSLYEGFGLPVLEAMARGVPVACSDAASLPEVAGDAALLFDPRDASAIAAAIRRLPAEAGRLRAAGLARAAQFSWERCARETLAVYTRA